MEVKFLAGSYGRTFLGDTGLGSFEVNSRTHPSESSRKLLGTVDGATISPGTCGTMTKRRIVIVLINN